MAVEVVIFEIPGHPRAKAVAGAMYAGIKRVGDAPRILSSFHYRRPEGEVAVFYGLAGRLAQALRQYPAAGKTAVYADLGFWGRKDGGRFAGFHKLSVNTRHPTAYFQDRLHDWSRAAAFGLEPKAWRRRTAGGHILLCGMGPKGAAAEGYPVEGWERDAVEALREHTDRPIWYRPKPNFPEAKAIPGTIMVDRLAPLEAQLRGCHAVVSHHSNAGVEALVAGVPNFTYEGVAAPQSMGDLSKIEAPAMLDTRRQWIADVAWTQWSVAEMAAGVAWRHLKDEGLVP